MDNSRILTICIPTYNRPEALKDQLQVLLPQLNKEVILVVRDNHSNYDLKKVAPELNYDKFEYVRNDINIGADANIARCMETCNTKWLWILGDDDLIKVDAVLNVLDLLKSNPDCCYINLQAKIEKTVIGFEDFANYFKIKGAFPTSFCTSLCLYNVEKLKSEMFFYYRNVSTMITQFVFLLKYLQNNPSEKCLFSTKQIIDDQSLDISWSREEFIIYTSLIIHIFRDEKIFLNKNVFKSLATMYYDFIFKEMPNISLHKKLKLLIFVISKIGFLNTLYYNYITIFDNLLYNVLSKKLYLKIKKIVIKGYLFRLSIKTS
jgi:glycosyltransferase involved in cell wall biosynthesis